MINSKSELIIVIYNPLLGINLGILLQITKRTLKMYNMCYKCELYII